MYKPVVASLLFVYKKAAKMMPTAPSIPLLTWTAVAPLVDWALAEAEDLEPEEPEDDEAPLDELETEPDLVGVKVGVA